MNLKYLKIGAVILGIATGVVVIKNLHDEHKKRSEMEKATDDYLARVNARTEELTALHLSNRLMFNEIIEHDPLYAAEVSSINYQFFNIIAHQPLD
jgi:hypothetical protein